MFLRKLLMGCLRVLADADNYRVLFGKLLLQSGKGDRLAGTSCCIVPRIEVENNLLSGEICKGYDVSVGENTNILSYGDAYDVAEWAIPAMQWACGSGMIQGIADGSTMNLVPQGNATRAQAAAILQRYVENVAKGD